MIYSTTLKTVQNPFKKDGGQIPNTLIESNSLDGLKNKARKIQENNGVGASTWTDPDCFKNGAKIGYFSYNMRLWK